MKCLVCKKRNAKKHANAKYCGPCAEDLKKRPVGRLTASQIRKAKKLAGTMKREDVAAAVGSGRTNFNRWARESGINFNSLKYKPETIQKVCEYYVEHGKTKTQKNFPKVKVRSIVERYLKKLDLPPRQARWTDQQCVELVKMAGIVSMRAQARWFDRPNAHRGSIQSAWMKKFKHGGGSTNGLSWHVAKHYTDGYCPVLQTKFWVTRNKTRQHESQRMLVLWVDLEKYMNPDTPNHIKDGIRALARFQRWVHGRNTIRNIRKMQKERQ